MLPATRTVTEARDHGQQSNPNGINWALTDCPEELLSVPPAQSCTLFYRPGSLRPGKVVMLRAVPHTPAGLHPQPRGKGSWVPECGTPTVWPPASRPLQTSHGEAAEEAPAANLIEQGGGAPGARPRAAWGVRMLPCL